jgi:hypothetical protein
VTGQPRKQRPRAQPDPLRFKPCARCGVAYRPVARWPEGVVCQYCYQRAKRTNGVCSGCGHRGVLPGVDGEGRSTCRTCSGIAIPVDCSRCGAETELFRANTCWRCVLAGEIDDLLAGPDGTVPASLVPLAQAIKTMKRENSGMIWLRRQQVRTLLRDLASGSVALHHEALDALPTSRTIEYVRELLVATGVLPARDKYLSTFLRWMETKLEGVSDPDHRRAVEAFARWHHLRNLRSQAKSEGQVPLGSFLRAKQSTTLAIDFLNWLKGRGRTLAECTQHDIDAWFGHGPTTRRHAQPFLYWAINTGRARGFRVPFVPHRSHPVLAETDRLAALRRLLLDDTLRLPSRIAGAFVLLYGQQANRIRQITVEQVRVAEDGVFFRPANDWIDVPDPLASLLASYLLQRTNMATAANPDSPWLFPGTMPGKPITMDGLLKQFLQAGVPALSGRSGTWQSLVREGPPTVLAEALGISPVTAMGHAARAGADWLAYASLRTGPVSASGTTTDS